MKLKGIILTTVAFLFFGMAAHAQTATPKVKKRQVNQQKRIHQGVASGELTKGEVVRLQKQQRNVQKHKKAVKSDGVVTKKERASLHAHQNRASKNIYRKKHNQRDRN